MSRQVPTRKQRFKIALVYAGLTAKQYAEERGITTGHLNQVLRGARTSASLLADVDAFIARHTRQAVAA